MGPLQAGGHAGIAEITRELKKIARSSAKVLRSVARRFTEEAGVPRCPLTTPRRRPALLELGVSVPAKLSSRSSAFQNPRYTNLGDREAEAREPRRSERGG